MSQSPQRIHVIDSHTAGEPTRVIIAGGPDLGTGPLAERRERLRCQFDALRRSVILEPRGSDVLVGALLTPPVDASAAAGVIFFNNVGYLNMCGHGTIGVAATLAYLGRIQPGCHRVETPVGTVSVEWHGGGTASLDNVPSFRDRTVNLEVPGLGRISGDIAWGGNWFFLTDQHGLELRRACVGQLTDVAWRIRRALADRGLRGSDGGEIDHIELTGPPLDPNNHGRNFVLCPGGAYDRSPCGTGTSAKLACLYADGKLRPGQVWRQESILGTVFEGWIRIVEGQLIPTIRGSAYITAEATLIIDSADPLATGIGP